MSCGKQGPDLRRQRLPVVTPAPPDRQRDDDQSSRMPRSRRWLMVADRNQLNSSETERASPPPPTSCSGRCSVTTVPGRNLAAPVCGANVRGRWRRGARVRSPGVLGPGPDPCRDGRGVNRREDGMTSSSRQVRRWRGMEAATAGLGHRRHHARSRVLRTAACGMGITFGVESGATAVSGSGRDGRTQELPPVPRRQAGRRRAKFAAIRLRTARITSRSACLYCGPCPVRVKSSKSPNPYRTPSTRRIAPRMTRPMATVVPFTSVISNQYSAAGMAGGAPERSPSVTPPGQGRRGRSTLRTRCRTAHPVPAALFGSGGGQGHPRLPRLLLAGALEAIVAHGGSGGAGVLALVPGTK